MLDVTLKLSSIGARAARTHILIDPPPLYGSVRTVKMLENQHSVPYYRTISLSRI
jgi:hypothetical protein